MKHLFTTAAVLFSMTAFAQVGINNTSPKATLDITAKTSGTKPEGLIIPQLAGSDIHTATAAGVYGAAQKGLIIYATSADSSPISATANITTAGYYYFDGTNWQKVMTGSVANADLTTGVGGIYKGSGSLSGNTIVTQGANTLAFTSTATNGFSVDGTTFSVDAANNRLGIGTSTPQARLHISGAGASPDQIRMTANISDWGLVSEDVGGQNGMPGESSFNITDRVNGFRRMTIGTGGSFRLGGNISVGNAALSIDGATNNVGIGTNAPNTNAALDVSSTTKGVKLPSLALTATNNASPLSAHVAGMLVYNTATAGTAPNNVVPGLYTNDGTQWILLQTPQTVNVSAPAGTVSYTAASTVPAGYLECDGAAVSRTTYATLFAAIGTTYGTGDGSSTFNLPDLRGEFVRGWDHGRGIDSGRGIGTWQKGSFIAGGANPNQDSISAFDTSSSTMPTLTSNLGWDLLTNTMRTSFYSTVRGSNLSGGSATSSLIVPDQNGGDYSAGITRPRNTALMPIIKY